jgi:hypothetical protein
MSAYGSQLWDFSHKDVQYFFVAWRKCVRRVWGLPARTRCNILPVLLCNTLPVEMQLHQRFIKFVHNMRISTNECVSTCVRMSIHGSGSDACNSINFICHKYSMSKYNILKHSSYRLSKHIRDSCKPPDELLYVSGVIHDLLDMRDNRIRNCILSQNEVDALLTALCTD